MFTVYHHPGRSAFLRQAASRADLRDTNLREANFKEADLSLANLSTANLTGAIVIRTNLTEAILTNCSIYGISAWDVHLEGATQLNLTITPPNQPTITVDNLEVA